VVEDIFEQSFSATCRLAAVRAATTVILYQLPTDSRQDLEQEALLELWRKGPAYDARRGSWRTFSEHVVANRLASLLRHMHSSRSGYGKEDPLEGIELRDAPRYNDIDLQTDIRRVLDGVSQLDRSVGRSLMDHTAIETSRRLRISRSTVCRSIERLRAAFTIAGFAKCGGPEARCTVHRHEAKS
jgi:DNA-directed RNA polymerase specialized sigma24 family protein